VQLWTGPSQRLHILFELPSHVARGAVVANHEVLLLGATYLLGALPNDLRVVARLAVEAEDFALLAWGEPDLVVPTRHT